jgi:nucleotide-binding universal stress UspA family protein
MRIQNILVPVDFGEASAAAVALAGHLADGCGAQLTLLHAEAADAPVYFTREQVDALASQRRQQQEQARRFLAAFGHRHTEAPFIAEIVLRTPIQAITDAAKQADLVVIGTHARTGAALWWLGSVAERVLRDLTTPVLVVHAHDTSSARITELGVYAAPGLTGENALALSTRIGAAIGAIVHDYRGRDVDPAEMFAGASMVVVAEPWVHDRAWRTRVGEPLIRSGKGPVLFVPEHA